MTNGEVEEDNDKKPVQEEIQDRNNNWVSLTGGNENNRDDVVCLNKVGVDKLNVWITTNPPPPLFASFTCQNL